MAIQPVEQGSAFAFRNVINNNFYELKVLSGASKPTQSTAAVVGQMYLDTSEGKMYFCSNVSGSVYTWKPFSEFSGSYNDLKDKPSLFSGNYDDLTNKPDSSKISYNNNLSRLEADNVQKAIDEIISLKAAKNGFAPLDSFAKITSKYLSMSDSIELDSSTTIASSKAVKTMADKLSTDLPLETAFYRATGDDDIILELNVSKYGKLIFVRGHLSAKSMTNADRYARFEVNANLLNIPNTIYLTFSVLGDMKWNGNPEAESKSGIGWANIGVGNSLFWIPKTALIEGSVTASENIFSFVCITN